MKPLYRNFLTQEEIDAQYRVAPSQEALIQARARAQQQSAHTRGQLSHVAGVRYGPTRDEHLDILGTGGHDKPVFVFLHGGYWRALSARDYSFVAEGPSARDMVTVSVNYTLAPRVGLGEIVRQARAAMAWVIRNIREYGGDPGRIVIGGHSAGAQLAAMCLLTDWSEDYDIDGSCLRGALLVSGVFDLSPLRYSFLQPQLQLTSETIAANSPVGLVRPNAVPLLLAVGAEESDEFRRQTGEFDQQWRLAGNHSELQLIANAEHFLALEPLLDADSAFCAWMSDRLV